MFLLDLEEGRPRALRVLPFSNRPHPFARASQAERERLLGTLRRLSAELGTEAGETPEGLAFDLSIPG